MHSKFENNVNNKVCLQFKRKKSNLFSCIMVYFIKKMYAFGCLCLCLQARKAELAPICAYIPPMWSSNQRSLLWEINANKYQTMDLMDSKPYPYTSTTSVISILLILKYLCFGFIVILDYPIICFHKNFKVWGLFSSILPCLTYDICIVFQYHTSL